MASSDELSNRKSSNSSSVKRRKAPSGPIQWPFGHGLSYTTFEYTNLQLPHEVKTSDDSFTLSFELKNTGAVAADEVVQIYLSPTSAEQPIRPIQLQGFARVSLQPGECKKVEVRMFTEQLGYYTNDGQRQWNIVPGAYTIKIGASSEDIRLEQQIVLSGETVHKPIRDFYFSETISH